jgi:low temperature requirement protein LtrA
MCVFFPYVGWAWYISLFTARVFDVINRDYLNRIITNLPSFSLLIGTLFGAFFTQYWILSVAFVGTVLAGRILLLSRIKGLPAPAVKYFRGYAYRTLGVMGLFVLGGIFVASQLEYLNNNVPESFIRYSIGASMVLLGFCGGLSAIHVVRPVTSRIRGMMNRPLTVARSIK